MGCEAVSWPKVFRFFAYSIFSSSAVFFLQGEFWLGVYGDVQHWGRLYCQAQIPFSFSFLFYGRHRIYPGDHEHKREVLLGLGVYGQMIFLMFESIYQVIHVPVDGHFYVFFLFYQYF